MVKLNLGNFLPFVTRERRRSAANSVTEDSEDMNLASSIETDLQFIYGLLPLESNTLAVIGKHDGDYVLRKYLYSGHILEQTILDECPAGLAKITVANVPCLAVSYPEAGRIDFHKMCEIQKIYAKVPCPRPGAMCAISSSSLGYVSCAGSNHVCFLDCSNEAPRLHDTLAPIRLKQARVWSITFSENSYKKMLVVSGPESGCGKIRAYDFEARGRLLWELSGQLKNKHPPINPQDVAYNSWTDTLFVACLEGYVYEISPRGKFCRAVLSPRQGLGNTCHLIWNRATHLILHHKSKEVETTKIYIFGSSTIHTFSEEELSDAFKKACSQNKEVWRARVAVIGTYRVCKTSVVHNLLGLPFVDQYVSTQGIHTQMAQTDKVLDVREVSEWNQIKKDSFEINEDDLQREVLLYITRNPTFVSGHNDVEGADAQPAPDDIEVIYEQSASLVDETPNPDETTLYKIRDALVKNKTQGDTCGTGNKSDRSFRISIWDFGGQVQFYATHHMFLDPKLVYLLVLDITKDLDSEVPTQFMGMFDRREVGIPKTVREFLDYWLSTIHFQAKHGAQNNHRGSTKLLPPVLIVLTHEDKIQSPDKETYITNFKKELRRYIDGKAYEPHVFAENIFVIDNKNRDQRKTDELKSTILKLASEQPGWGVPRPVNWLRLENAIYRESEVIRTPFLPNGRVLELARELKIDDDNLGNFISFHHALGDILYFKDTDKVVTKPQWLIDAFSQVITAPEFYSEKDLEPFKDQVRRLDKEGVASIELLSHMWKDSVNFLLFLMVQFGLMIPFEEEQSNGSSFYIPCMLPAIDLCNFDQGLENNSRLIKLAPAVVYRLGEGFLPLGSFQKLICQCRELQDWSIHGRVSYNAVLFRVTSLHEILISLTSRAYGIRFEIWSPTEANTNLNLCKLREKFEGILSKAIGPTQYTTNICPCENSADAEEGCLIPVKQLMKNNKRNFLYAICPRHTKVIKPDEYKAWFEPRREVPSAEISVAKLEEGSRIIVPKNCNQIIRSFSKRITDESILYDVGMRLGLQHNDIAGIRTDNKFQIQEAGYHVLQFWFNLIRVQSSTTPISQILEEVFQGDTFERKADSSSKTFQNEGHEPSFPAGASTKIQEQSDMNLIRKISKLITDEVKLQDIGVELHLSLDEIRAILTDYHHSIEQAGFQVLKRWYERQQLSRDHSKSILMELCAVFKSQGLSLDQINF